MLFIQKKKRKKKLNLLTKLNRNDLHCHFKIHLKCSSYKGYWVVDLTQLNTTHENCEDQKEGYHLRTCFEHGDETSFRNPKNKILLTYNKHFLFIYIISTNMIAGTTS